MAKVYEFLANGFEDIEALAPVDILRRGGVEVVTVSVSDSLYVESAHGITMKADALVADADFSDADMLVLPGGMPGTRNLGMCEKLRQTLVAQNEKGGLIAAICAAPMVLGGLGLLAGRRATCYPGFEEHLAGAEYVEESVVVSGNVTTGRGPGAAMAFGYQLLSNFVGADVVEALKTGMIYK